ncbi:hypothetical protein A5N15_05875 [Rothia kristinae]|uniref:Uncharacterized protein n=1 Tax=Rothia kristinae TaxID=37923 RepID=A0A657IWM2_9MICC|nr:hypothetical protein A5N15_05875 [Rothia kristinae]
MPWASRIPGAAASANLVRDSPRRRQAIQAPSAPQEIAPMMPMPPSQIFRASHGFRPGPK